MGAKWVVGWRTATQPPSDEEEEEEEEEENEKVACRSGGARPNRTKKSGNQLELVEKAIPMMRWKHAHHHVYFSFFGLGYYDYDAPAYNWWVDNSLSFPMSNNNSACR
jgi:hypothetical protein